MRIKTTHEIDMVNDAGKKLAVVHVTLNSLPRDEGSPGEANSPGDIFVVPNLNARDVSGGTYSKKDGLWRIRLQTGEPVFVDGVVVYLTLQDTRGYGLLRFADLSNGENNPEGRHYVLHYPVRPVIARIGKNRYEELLRPKTEAESVKKEGE